MGRSVEALVEGFMLVLLVFGLKCGVARDGLNDCEPN